MTSMERHIDDLQHEVRHLRELIVLKDEAYAALKERLVATKNYDDWLAAANLDVQRVNRTLKEATQTFRETLRKEKG